MKQETLDRLAKIVGKQNLTTEKEQLICYSYDATGREFLPHAVIFPSSAEEISRVMKLANADGFPVTARGAGSGFVGGSLPVSGGVVLSTKRMNSIVEIDCENMLAVVEPGVVTGHLQQEVEKEGLFYPPDPSSHKFCTLGGNIAMGAGGPRAVKYGVTRDYVMGLEVVLPTGEMISCGTRTSKGVVGYDMTRLMVGSEGTLGIVTRITLKLVPKPESKATLYVEFPGAVEAGRAVSAITASGIVPSILEFIDRSALTCIGGYLKEPLADEAGAILLIEMDGFKTSVDEGMVRLKGLCTGLGAIRTVEATDPREAESLWEARRAISPSLFKLGTKKINEDIVVPRNKVPDLIANLEGISGKYGLVMANFGHAGDGNIHVNIMINKGDPDDEKRADEAVREVFQAALDLGGTISGEHGIGINKQPYIGMELSEKEMELMKGIKRLFDPFNVLNPGKIFL